LSELNKYSFTYPASIENCFRVHRLLQEVVRGQIEDTAAYKLFIKTCFDSIGKTFSYRRNAITDIRQAKLHFESVDKFNRKLKDKNIEIPARLLYHIGLYLYDYEGDYQKALPFLERANICLKDTDTIELEVNIKRHLVKFYTFSKKLNEAQNVHEKLKIIKINYQHLDEELWFKVDLDYHYLLKAQKKYDEARNLLEVVLQHTNTPDTKANCYFYLGKLYLSLAEWKQERVTALFEKYCNRQEQYENLEEWQTDLRDKIENEELPAIEDELSDAEDELESIIEKAILCFAKTSKGRSQEDYVGIIRNILLLPEVAVRIDSKKLLQKAFESTYKLCKNTLPCLNRATYQKEYKKVIMQLINLTNNSICKKLIAKEKREDEIIQFIYIEKDYIRYQFGKKSNEYAACKACLNWLENQVKNRKQADEQIPAIQKPKKITTAYDPPSSSKVGNKNSKRGYENTEKKPEKFLKKQKIF